MGIDTLTDPSPAVSAGLSSRHDHDLLDANRAALVLDPAFRGTRRPPARCPRVPMPAGRDA